MSVAPTKSSSSLSSSTELEPRGRPDAKNIDGRPVWESPVFCYDDLISDEYDKRRKSVLKYANNDKVLTTKILDTWAEWLLLLEYGAWVVANTIKADVSGNHEEVLRMESYNGLGFEVLFGT